MVIKSDRLPRPGETVLGGTFFLNAGGKGANQAVAAARLGGHVHLVANVGNDMFGKQSVEQFAAEKIKTDFISIDPVQPSGVALINVDAKGENCIAVAPGSNGNLTPALLKNALEKISPGDFVLMQLEIPITTVEFVIAECAKKSIPIIINPAPAAQLKDELLKNIFLLTPNESEAEFLTGIPISDSASIKNNADYFHSKGIANVVITLGKRGAYWSSKTGAGFIDAPVVTPVDTTAAGDCFNGALAVALSQNKSLPESVMFACAAASVSVTRMGAQASMPALHEIENVVH
jgi:ribokinase